MGHGTKNYIVKPTIDQQYRKLTATMAKMHRVAKIIMLLMKRTLIDLMIQIKILLEG